ncbi:NrfD/PsrC family molybdoenzyme membrane anchor subunit [Geomonas propionica]|uniref:Polysulfide reductase NrfD n=1 Tax=Geomonas propionica TaxID=2798582 RepID=A0ABS0YXF1_9BACT|nr:NrfD/PsrC family molybdoenzyme membrane anchor subunit [Geomonas propionica]MBJ6802160.1 polysulfide reductase NrfD [Geomonas propionica]
MSPDNVQVPEWAWYYIAVYFFVAGTSAGAYFIGAMEELFSSAKEREVSRAACYVAFPLLLLVPIPLIADLGRPGRFWHLFIYNQGGYPYLNLQSPMSVGSWVLLVFGGCTLLSFLDNLVADRVISFPLFSRYYNRIPRKLYALVGSLAGFFIAGYTGVLLNVTARPFWAATSPLMGALFLVSGASTGAAAISLYLIWRQRNAGEEVARLESFDRALMISELLLIAVLLVLAGHTAQLLVTLPFLVMFWLGAVALGIAAPLWFKYRSRRQHFGGAPHLAHYLCILAGGLLLRISLLQAGQL